MRLGLVKLIPSQSDAKGLTVGRWLWTGNGRAVHLGNCLLMAKFRSVREVVFESKSGNVPVTKVHGISILPPKGS